MQYSTKEYFVGSPQVVQVAFFVPSPDWSKIQGSREWRKLENLVDNLEKERNRSLHQGNKSK